jgi:phage FluMu gp28-like protein
MAVPLYPYQERWVRDESRFKVAVKATQIGYSFAAALEAVLDCIAHRTLWIVLSRGERQSLEFMQKVVQHATALRAIGSRLESSAFFASSSIAQHEVKFPNGSRIIGLPANPDTARGYTGNMILDEFAFHQHDREIWAAAFGRVSRGVGDTALKLRVISTPNGTRGKFYEIAKEAGVVSRFGSRDSGFGKEQASDECWKQGGQPPLAGVRGSDFLGHWCDVHSAVEQGCPIDADALRQTIGDEETWRQEYECAFLSESANYIPVEMILACEDREAGGWIRDSGGRDFLPSAESRVANRELYYGYDVGRVRDLAVVAVVERVGDVLWTRELIEMPRARFSEQEKILSEVIPQCARGAVDATGIGMEMAERLAEGFPGKVEPVTFTAARKQDLAVRMKRAFEEKTIRIPERRELRWDLQAVKRVVSSAGNIRFDAERSEQGHADRFWALALALYAAAGKQAAWASGGIESERDWYEAEERGSGFGARESGRVGQGAMA